MTTKLGDRERRLATIMAADIVGYSRLMDADEEGTYTALRAARAEVIDPKIEEYEGRIVKHLGDGFLAEFPTVMAAIQFAMSLQEEEGRRAEGLPKEQQIKFRIGVNLGDIIVDDDGDIFGDGVNVAARLEALAIPGGICISGPVYETVHKKLDVGFDDLGDQSVKNISTPVHAYDIRWPGEAGTPDERAVKPTTKPKPLGLIAGGAVAAAAVLGLVLWQMNPFEPEDEAAPKNSIAVLPFVNMSDDASNEYFSDGISEELLNLLVKIPKLRVISRSSAFSFKGKNLEIPEIARRLNVAHILEGSVRKAGNQVRITAQLVDARSDTHLWSKTYDRTLDNIFAIQDEVASEVVAQLKITLLDDVPKVRETDPEAYALYLQGRHYFNLYTAASIKQAETLLKQALEVDPRFVPAWTELGIVYHHQADPFNHRPFDEGYGLARDAIEQALALDPQYGRAYAVLAWIELDFDWDFAAASQHFEQALKLNPGDARASWQAATLNRVLGRLDEAIDLNRRSIALDPLSPNGHHRLGRSLYEAYRLDEAADSFKIALSLSPGWAGAHYRLGRVLLAQGDAPGALAEMEQEAIDAYRLTGTAIVQHALGDAGASDAALQELIEKYAAAAAYQVAEVYAFRGEVDHSFDWLKQAYDNHDTGMVIMLLDSLLVNLHDDPRWEPLLDKMGLPH